MTGETDWEQCYVDGVTPWDQGAPSPVLMQYLDAQLLTGSVAVPGCGSGHDIAEIARRSEMVKVLGLDISPSAVTVANENLREYANASAEQVDLFDLASRFVGRFDWIWEHTCFCAIDPDRRREYVEAMFQLLKPHGKLVAVFYLRPKERDDDRVGPPFGCTIEGLDALFGDRFLVEKSWVPNVAYSGREGRELMRVLQKNPG